MRSLIILAVLGSVLAACSDQSSPVAPDADRSASLSQGGAPTPVPPFPSFDPFNSAICGFPIFQDITGKLKTLEFPNGRTIAIAPALKITWTNGLTGGTVTRSITGALHINPLPNGGIEFVFTGHTAFSDDVEGFFDYLSGRFTFIIGPDGSLVQRLEGNGLRTDMCAVLGGA
jgi:hypothetical protein